MNRKEKAELIETLQTAFNGSSTIVVAHQVGMTVAESGDLRQKMRDAGAGFKVTKNRIAKLALKGTRFEDLDSLFTGPTAVGPVNRLSRSSKRVPLSASLAILFLVTLKPASESRIF